MNILYLAHDLDDSAIWRREAMFECGGATVAVAGFERKQTEIKRAAVSLGATRDGDFKQRIWRVVSNLPNLPAKLRNEGLAKPDVIVARNMEALALGVRLKAHWGGDVPLVYELLDIHRLQHGDGTKSKFVRAVEACLLQSTDLILISSNAFQTHYLHAYKLPDVPTHLVENKLLLDPGDEERTPIVERKNTSGRISIGWFGILRCAWTLSQLDALTRANPGQYYVTLRGRPALDQIPDFHQKVASNPDLVFGGAYRWPDDLGSIYADCDFVWMIDRFDSGGNSDWLLPNRLYEGGMFGAIPIGLAGTEIATRLRALGIGLVVEDTELETMRTAIAPMSTQKIEELRSRVLALPRSTWVADSAECRALVKKLSTIKPLPEGQGVPVMDQ